MGLVALAMVEPGSTCEGVLTAQRMLVWVAPGAAVQERVSVPSPPTMFTLVGGPKLAPVEPELLPLEETELLLPLDDELELLLLLDDELELLALEDDVEPESDEPLLLALLLELVPVVEPEPPLELDEFDELEALDELEEALLDALLELDDALEALLELDELDALDDAVDVLLALEEVPLELESCWPPLLQAASPAHTKARTDP